MLRIFQGNRQERLLEALAGNIREPVGGNPLVPEIIVCERGIDRWLWQSLAREHGIAANLDMQLPAGFIWQTLRALFPEAPRQSPYERGALAWRLMSLLEPARLTDPAFATVAHYLAGDEDQRKRFQLARRLADLFDQYLVYRHDMILAWERGELTAAGPDEAWQQQLWRAIVAQAGRGHRAHLVERFFAAAQRGELDSDVLPARASVFGVPALPPVYVNILATLGEHMPIDIYALNPCAEFWGENLKPREQLEAFARYGDAAALHLGDNNPLLANGGARIQQYFSDLAEYDNAPAPTLFEEPVAKTLLSRLQQAIYHNQPPQAATPDDIDDSVQVHGAYSLLREVEVLHDRLLDAFHRDPSLAPHDVLVLTPDITLAAPYIDAVFGAARGTPRDIPYSIADLARGASHPLVAAFRQLLALPDSRLTASEVMGLLETPAIARRFGRLGEADLDALRRWIAASGIRWGLDANDRAAHGLPAEHAHSWKFGLERLFVGLTVDNEDVLVAQRAPFADIEGSDGVALGKLQTFVDRLAVVRQRLARAHTATSWHALVTALRSEFFEASTPEEDKALQTIDEAAREFLDELLLADHEAEITPAVFRADFDARLELPAAHGGLLRGAVTFARLAPARSLPFRMIALIGMNHDRFPHADAPATFDLVAAKPRRGDRSRRDDDRHLFLETLLAARDCLYVSYTDRSLRDSTPQQPSVVVSELIDAVLGPQTDPGVRSETRATLVTGHPLQPFSTRQFDGSDPRLFSYDSDWIPAAAAQGASRQARPAFCPEPLALEDNAQEQRADDVRLADLHRCLKHPARWFLERRLGVFLRDDGGDEPEDDEPFALADDFAVNDDWVEAALAGRSADEQYALLAARGELPQGAFARVDWQARVERFAPLVARLADDPASWQPLDVEILLPGGRRLAGRLATVAGKQQRVVSTVDKPHARLLLQAWIDHLALCAVRGTDCVTRVECVAGTTRLAAPAQDPVTLLADLVALFDDSHRQPLRFFPKSAWAWASTVDDDEVKAMSAARRKWEGGYNSQSEPESADRSFRTCFGHEESPLTHADFALLARRVFTPLLAALADDTNAEHDA